MTARRRRVASGTAWESAVGYSRAVRAGDRILVSGTTATDHEGRIVGRDDPYLQARRALENIHRALSELGADLPDVVRTRIYVTNIDHWEQIGRAHREAFGAAGPATSMVEIRRLVSPEMLVEIEAEAVVGDADGT